MIGYACPECGNRMRSLAELTDPPVYQAQCEGCRVVYRRNPATGQYYLPPLPRDYERVGINARTIEPKRD